MYTKTFGDYNTLMGKIIMTEEDTLYVLLSNEFGQNVPKEFQNITPDEWAKYAFENNKEYIVTYYKEGKHYVTVSNTLLYVCFSYYEDRGGELFRFMHIWFDKGYDDKKQKDEPFILFENRKIFLGQIDMIGDLGSGLLFNSQKKKDNVRFEEWIEEDGIPQLVEQTGTADLSKNWFDAPKHYLDYERFLDYQNLFEVLPNKPQRK